MATGSGLRKRFITYDNLPIGDLIAAVRYQDYIIFYSFSELYMGKNFKNTSFVYNKDEKIEFSPEISKLLSKNNFLAISSGVTGKNIQVKKPLYDVFHFKFFSPTIRKFKIRDRGVNRESIQSVFSYLNGREPGAVRNELNPDGTLTEAHQSRLNNYLKSANMLRANDEAVKNNMFILRVTTSGFVIPVDLSEMATNLLRMNTFDFKEVSLKKDDLPRVSEVKLMQYILSREGRKEIDTGKLCYTILPYPPDNLALVTNIDIGKNNIITKVNEKEFIKSFVNFKNKCFPSSFKVNDEVSGILENGVYVLNDRKKLSITEAVEREYFQNNIETYKNTTFSKNIVTKFRKNLKYPKSTLDLLVMRDSLDVSILDRNTVGTYKEFTEAFYNTVSLYRPVRKGFRAKSYISDSVNRGDYAIIKDFRNQVVSEFILFIKINFLQNLRITARKDSSKKKIIENMIRINREILGRRENLFIDKKTKERDITKKNYSPRFSNPRIEKEDFIFIIRNLTGIQDQSDALVEFFSNPSILYGDVNGIEYEKLRLISYFILCTKNEYCDKIKNYSENDSQNLTFPFLLSAENKMYYNKKLQIFINENIQA
jgi:hypothetical protein